MVLFLALDERGEVEKGYEIKCRVILPSAVPLQQLRDVLYWRLHLARPSDLFSMNLADAFASLASSGNLKEVCRFFFLQNSLCFCFSLGVAIIRSAVGSCSS